MVKSKKNLSEITFLWKLGTLPSMMTGSPLPLQNWDLKYSWIRRKLRTTLVSAVVDQTWDSNPLIQSFLS